MEQPFAPDKIFAHKARIKEWLKSGLSRPITFELDITNRCNSNCPACFGFYPALDSSSMRLADIKDVLRQVRAAGGKAVTFTGGGEPTVHPHIKQALLFARSCGLDVALITNGLNLDGELAAAVLASCTWTRISLDAASPEVFRATHGLGRGAFERVLANTAMLARMKRAARSRCTVGIGFLTSGLSAADIPAFAALGRQLGADYAQYRPLLRRHGEKDIDYSRAPLSEALALAGKKYSARGYNVLCSTHKYRLIESGATGRNYGKCYGHNFAAVICADMKMYVCCHLRGVARYCVGDLKKDSLAGIWASGRRAEAAGGIDFRHCPPLCRCDSFNRILWELKTGKDPAAGCPPGTRWQHKNFI